MPGILVVERSTTLLHLLNRTLAATPALGEWSELSSYADALEHLKQADRMEQRYRALLLGAPARITREFTDLVAYLSEPREWGLPVIVLAHEKTPEIALFTDRRAEVLFLPWSQFNRIPTSLRQLAPGAELNSDAGTAPARNGVKVLFVDDSASVRLAYQQLLERNGYATDVAPSIAEAYTRAKGGDYDLAVIDYFLTDGEGDELCRKLRDTPAAAHTMLAIITGTYREEVIKTCLDAGAVECMFKNEAKELFLARVGSLSRQITMQKKVATEKQRLDGILGSVGDGVYGVNTQGVVTFINPMGVQLLGFDDESEIVDRPAHQLFHYLGEDGRRIEPNESRLARAYETGDAVATCETVFVHRHDGALPVECSLLPLEIGGRREGAVVVFRDISERKSADRLRWELSHDALTGLHNARHFNQAMTIEVLRRREHGGYAALLYLDVDRYTHITDAGGQAVAEQLLIDLGQQLRRRLREGDVLARLEGDRLGLLLTSVQLDNLFSIADGFRELARQCHFVAHGSRRQATMSVGVAVISRDTPSAEYSLDRARAACTEAKRRGRDQTQIYVGEHERRVARELEAGWSERFRRAIEEDRFVLYLQPIVPVAALPEDESKITEREGWRLNGTGVSHPYLFELLVRMVEPNGELIAPSVFVPLAERIGMMPKIDLWIVTRALRHLAGLKSMAHRLAFNVNLSNQTLSDPETLKMVADGVRASNVAPGQLVFEITETSEMGNVQDARRFVQTMKTLGCRFALDDFGTGFSSLTHLRHLPVDFVKIEGSFIEGLADSETDFTMVNSIAQLARSMNLKVIAEHVDSYATLARVRECGVEYVQGNYLGAPRPLREIDFPNLLSGS